MWIKYKDSLINLDTISNITKYELNDYGNGMKYFIKFMTAFGTKFEWEYEKEEDRDHRFNNIIAVHSI